MGTYIGLRPVYGISVGKRMCLSIRLAFQIRKTGMLAETDRADAQNFAHWTNEGQRAFSIRSWDRGPTGMPASRAGASSAEIDPAVTTPSPAAHSRAQLQPSLLLTTGST